ncbi:hypothetical protein GCM10010222_15580 [Streptomyces tanashiensis]|nr:hypothetical protein GCM10010222_15580 [Streptomyces tanashiensis]
MEFLPPSVVGVDGEGDPVQGRRQFGAAPGTHEHVQTSSPSPRSRGIVPRPTPAGPPDFDTTGASGSDDALAGAGTVA